MKISRYITVPFVLGFLILLNYLLYSSEWTLNGVLLSIICGAVIGIGFQIFNDYRTQKIKPDAREKDFAVRHKKQTFLLCDYETAFDLCLESVGFVKKGKVKFADKESGFIRAKTNISWISWGNSIEFKLKRITENTTEIEVSVNPVLRTAMPDLGEGFEVIKTIQNFIDAQNELLTYKFLEAKSEIPIDISQISQTKIKK